MNILKIVLQVLLVIMFSYFGVLKITGSADMVTAVQSFNYATWLMRLVGLLEVSAAICLLLGVIVSQPRNLINIGGLIIVILTTGAVYSHFFRQKNIGEGMIPLVVGLIMVAVLFLHNRNTTTVSQVTS